MKILLCILLFGACSSVGYYYKYKCQIESDFLKFLQKFENFYDSNMTLFKNNILEIVENFKNSLKGKDVKFSQIFSCKSKITSVDEIALKKFISDEASYSVILNFLKTIGKNDYEFEKEKNKNFENYLKSACLNAKEKCEKKGNLYFKLSLALGAVICIIVW